MLRILQDDINIKIPQAVHSTKNGFSELFRIFSAYLNSENRKKVITVDFRANTWFDANLLPIVFAFVFYGQKNYEIESRYSNQPDDKLHRLLIRNNFAKECFDMEYRPRRNETAVPFKVFRASDTYGFGSYMDAEIVRYFPNMEARVKKDLSCYIQELFGNAQIHGGCNMVFTCGQYYYQNHKMDFTIVDVGNTIRDNVIKYLTDLNKSIPTNCISWAVEPEHSTKITNSGGIGLSLMHDFIYFNHGKFQIVSGNEFWELNARTIEMAKLNDYFPGTIVNIEIDQNDKKFYRYQENISLQELF